MQGLRRSLRNSSKRARKFTPKLKTELALRVLLIASLTVAAVGAEAPPIRQFSVPQLEKLGGELCRRDRIAAQAADVVAETQPLSKSLKMRGWVTELHKEGDIVYLIAETASDPCLAYTVTFHKTGKPAVEDKRGQPLPEEVALRYKARTTAAAALDGKFFDAKYNFEVLNDPDGSGFLVYALAATNKKGEILTGGHYRVTVSSDGGKAKRVDLLNHFIKEQAPAGAETAYITSSQVTSNIPVETWLYSSCLYHVPIMIGTMDKNTWLIANGRIHKFTKKEIQELESSTKKK